MCTEETLEKAYTLRPFKERNADKIDLVKILDLFVEPQHGLDHPFEYKDCIIKGCRGSGKTMYLRANHAYYLYTLIPEILAGNELILPIYIRLNDFQQIADPFEIYKSFIKKIVVEIIALKDKLSDAKKLAKIHQGVLTFPYEFFPSGIRENRYFIELKKLNSKEYTDAISKEGTFGAYLEHGLLKLTAEQKNTINTQITTIPNPDINYLDSIFMELFPKNDIKILLLLDEVSSLSKTFFKESSHNDSFFEILMNQLRTRPYLKTKIAVYPHTYSDILVESCYGDILKLQEDIIDKEGYDSFRIKCIDMMGKYLNCYVSRTIKVKDVFFIKENDTQITDTIEQIIYASNGNIRRFIKIAEDAMEKAYIVNRGLDKVYIHHVFNALNKNAKEMEDFFDDIDKEFVHSLVKICKERKAFIFQCPNRAPILSKFTDRSTEHNIIFIKQPGTGRRGTIYSFDYAYCVLSEIPTHYIKATEKIDTNRSVITGEWIKKIANITESNINAVAEPRKIEGKIENIRNSSGTIVGFNKKTYFWKLNDFVNIKNVQEILEGDYVKFFPVRMDDSYLATYVEKTNN